MKLSKLEPGGLVNARGPPRSSLRSRALPRPAQKAGNRGGFGRPVHGRRCDPENAERLAVQAVWSEPVSGTEEAISLLNREKTGKINVLGQYGGTFGRIISSNQ